MKSLISTALASFLNGLCEAGNGGAYEIVDLYTIALTNGITLRWAAWSLPISFPSSGIYGGGSVGGNTRASGHTYSATGGYVNRSQITQYLKLKTAEAKLTISANPTMLIPGTSASVLAAIAQGMFAGAMVYIDRLWAQTAFPLDLTLGTMVWFVGRVAEIDVNRARAIVTCKDPTILLDDQFPRNLYLTGCNHYFGDAGCTYPISTSGRGSGAAAVATGAIQAGSTTVTLNTNLTQPGPLASPTGTPTYSLLTGQTNVNLPAATYYVVTTFIGASGESLPSSELSVPVSGGGANGTTATLLQVNAPSSPPVGATGWNIYVGLASGEEEFQETFNGFTGSNATWTQSGTLAQGAAPPVQGTLGYFAGGQITFTSGVNSGLSQSVTSYSNPGSGGIVIVTPPLLVAPSTGDAFSITAQCDRSIAMCTYRWQNQQFYKGFPYLPAPEIAV